MTGPAGTGARLYGALNDADAAVKAVWASWDTLPRTEGGWIDREIRDDYHDRLHAALADYETAASRCYGYFESGQPTAAEAAAWALADPALRP